MIKLYYKLIFTICGIGILYCASSVQAIDNINDYGDCRELPTPKAEYSIYNKELSAIAWNNLRSYCCNNKKTYIIDADIQCKETLSDTYVDSPRLYDHLIDVGMRYLD
jgi:hypothetical protein